MPFVLDESSYRIDKTVFPDKDEAEERAAEAARILGRPITVYELLEGVLHFAFRVMPDGSTAKDNPTVEHESGDVIEPSAPAVLGEAADLDAIAQTLEAAGRPDLAAVVDRCTAGPFGKQASRGNISLHLPGEVVQMAGEAYNKLVTLKLEFDAMEEIPNSLKSLYKQTTDGMNAARKLKDVTYNLQMNMRKATGHR